MSASLSTRLLLAFLLPTALLLSALGGLGYTLARRILEEELGQSLSALAAAAASQVSGERMLTIEPGDDVQGTRTWKNLTRLLEEVRRASGVRRVFAVDREGRVRADVGGSLPVGAEATELTRDRAEFSQTLEGARAASQVLFRGSDGRLYKTGYAPIRGATGVVGAIAVEGSAAFFGPLRQLGRAFALLSLATLFVLTAVALATARGLARPLRRLMDSALRIGRGDLTTPVPREPTREIGILARELEVMRGALESRDRQLKLMLGGVAHEVRNPLGGMELYAGLLAEDLQSRDTGEAAKHVGAIRREIHYLKRVVEDFLAFAREQPLTREKLSALSLLSGAAEMLTLEAKERGVELQLACAPGELEADGSLLTAALVNLLKNALQASPRGGVVYLQGEKHAERYTIQVRNTGSPIPPELQARIFEPFFTTRQQGSGLGLPLAQKIARAHGGDLTCQSTPDETVFTLELPRS